MLTISFQHSGFFTTTSFFTAQLPVIFQHFIMQQFLSVGVQALKYIENT
jgi:hypothetical protein